MLVEICLSGLWGHIFFNIGGNREVELQSLKCIPSHQEQISTEIGGPPCCPLSNTHIRYSATLKYSKHGQPSPKVSEWVCCRQNGWRVRGGLGHNLNEPWHCSQAIDQSRKNEPCDCLTTPNEATKHRGTHTWIPANRSLVQLVRAFPKDVVELTISLLHFLDTSLEVSSSIKAGCLEGKWFTTALGQVCRLCDLYCSFWNGFDNSGIWRNNNKKRPWPKF